MSDEDPTQPDAHAPSPVVGRVVDVLFPVVLSVLIYFGLEAFLNAGGGPYYRLGIFKQLQILLICAFVYAYLVRRLFKRFWPQWWP